MAMDEDDRVQVLYHGTLRRAAEMILAERNFGIRVTFFAFTPSLADYFAHRARDRAGRGEQIAVIKVSLYESDYLSWKTSRLVTPKSFDEGDAPELRGQIQVVFTAEGVRQLNIYSFKDEWSILP